MKTMALGSAISGVFSIGLKSDGTVVTTELNEDGQCVTQGWKDIVAIKAGLGYIVGLKADGTVVCTDPEFVLVEGIPVTSR